MRAGALALLGLVLAAPSQGTIVLKMPPTIEIAIGDSITLRCSSNTGDPNTIQWFHYPGAQRALIYGFGQLHEPYGFILPREEGQVSALFIRRIDDRLRGRIQCQDEAGRGDSSTTTIIIIKGITCSMAPIPAPPLLVHYSSSKWSLLASCIVQYEQTPTSRFIWRQADDDLEMPNQVQTDGPDFIKIDLIVNRDDAPKNKRIKCRSSILDSSTNCVLDLDVLQADWSLAPAGPPISEWTLVLFGILIVATAGPLLLGFAFWLYAGQTSSPLQGMTRQSIKAWAVAVAFVVIGPILALCWLIWAQKKAARGAPVASESPARRPASLPGLLSDQDPPRPAPPPKPLRLAAAVQSLGAPVPVAGSYESQPRARSVANGPIRPNVLCPRPQQVTTGPGPTVAPRGVAWPRA